MNNAEWYPDSQIHSILFIQLLALYFGVQDQRGQWDVIGPLEALSEHLFLKPSLSVRQLLGLPPLPLHSAACFVLNKEPFVISYNFRC